MVQQPHQLSEKKGRPVLEHSQDLQNTILRIHEVFDSKAWVGEEAQHYTYLRY